jgi:transcriptional regulator with XRE-family HTH domain
LELLQWVNAFKRPLFQRPTPTLLLGNAWPPFAKRRGLHQVELAAALEISQRMVAYYESPGSTPPAHLLPHIAAALGVSIDALYGQAPQPKQLAKQEVGRRLRRRLLAIEKLETNDKRRVLQMIEAFIERGQLKRKVASQTQA